MIGNIISHYRITEKIGSGGMGVVYKAQDTKLDRFVALKFLPYEFTQDEEAVQRFINEAKTASSLQHDNICTVHEIGDSHDETGGQHFICMDYYIGETLKQKLDKGVTGSNEWADVLIQTAEGLKAAHEKGVIHRDIKPSNIFVTNDGKVKILDFGLAKGMESTQLTRQGTTAGTVSYMSPEQLTGSKVDSRTDIWSFGVLMFELLCGERPFKGDIEHAIIYSIINEEADCEPLDECDIPNELKDIICKCLEKNPSNRYRSVNDLLSDLKSVYDPSTHSLTASSRSDYLKRLTFSKLFRSTKFRIVVAIALIIIIILLIPDGDKRILSTKMHVAVLPIPTITEYSEGDKLALGLHKSLIKKLGDIRATPKIKNSDKTLSIVPFNDIKDFNVESTFDAVEKCNANYTISISVTNFANYFEAYIELIDATVKEETRLFSAGKVLDSLKSIPNLQRKLFREISTMIEIWSEDAISIAEAGLPNDDEAYDYYLKGIGYLSDYELVENINKSIEYFRKAVRSDTNYSLAYAGLGEAYFRKYEDERNVKDADSSKKYSYLALRKNPDLSEAYVSMGIVDRLNGLHDKAIKNFNKAVDIDPNNDDAFRELGRVYIELGEIEQAVKIINSAVNIDSVNWSNYNYLGHAYSGSGDYVSAKAEFKKVINKRPYNVLAYNNLGAMHFYLHQFDSALTVLNRSIEIEPTIFGYHLLGVVHFNLHNFQEAIDMFLVALEFSENEYELWGNLAESYYWSGQKDKTYKYFSKAIELGTQLLEINPKDTYVLTNIAGYYSRIGDEENTTKLLRRAIRYGVTDNSEMYTIASTYEFIGDRDKALEWLEKAIKNGLSTAEIERYLGFEELRKDERYENLVNPL